MEQRALSLKRDTHMCNNIKYSWFSEYIEQNRQLVKFYQSRVQLLDMKWEYFQKNDFSVQQMYAFEEEVINP